MICSADTPWGARPQARAITELRNQRVIDDIVLRELQAEMDLEEVQLLDPADTG